jgi:hypothetical protein
MIVPTRSFSVTTGGDGSLTAAFRPDGSAVDVVDSVCVNNLMSAVELAVMPRLLFMTRSLCLGILGLLWCSIGLADDLWAKPITKGSWLLGPSDGIERWLVVHAVPSDHDPAFHVEVLQAEIGDPAWKFRRLAPHMAVSEAALRRSIRGRSSRKEPYPEAYEYAYESWRKDGQGKTCTTTVIQCL